MADATNANELESLVTRFTIDSTDFMTKSAAIIAETQTLSAAISGLSGEVILAVNGMTQVAAAAVTVMGQMSAALGGVAQSLGTVTAGTGVAQLTTEINSLKTAMSGLKVNRLQTLTTNVQGFAGSLAAMGATATNVGQLRTELDTLVTWLTNSAANFPKGATQLARSLSRITAAVHDMSLIQPGVMLANVQTITQAVNMLSTANAANLHQVAAALGNIGRAMRNIAGAGGMGGGGIPPGGPFGGLGGAGGWGGPVGRLSTNLNRVAPAAGHASTSLRGLAHDAMIMQRNAEGAGAAILALRYAWIGLGALGVYQFSQMDDALTRAMVHVRDFGLTSRAELRQGIFGVSGQSTSSVLEVTKAADRLMSSGLSATAAMKALGEAENFTVASGMKASEATKGLVDVMHGMGLAIADADGSSTTFRANLTKLSDLLVGVSAQSGATEKQMMEAFTSRFQTASREAQLTIEESLAVLGALARQGEGYRGQKGGNLAARGIEAIVGDLSANGQKLNMFGQTAFDSAGKVRPLLEILTELQGMMGKVGTDKFIADLKFSNLGGPEKVNAVEPLLRTIAAMKDLRMEMAFMGGSAEKAANAIKGTLMGQVQTLWNNLNATAMVIGEALAPALAAIMAPLNAMLNAFTQLNPVIQTMIVWGGLVLVAWRPLLWLFPLISNYVIGLATYPFKLLYNTVVATGSWFVKTFTKIGESIYYVGGLLWHFGNVIILGVSAVLTALPGLLVDAFVELGKIIGWVRSAVVDFYHLSVWAFKQVAWAMEFPKLAVLFMLQTIRDLAMAVRSFAMAGIQALPQILANFAVGVSAIAVSLISVIPFMVGLVATLMLLPMVLATITAPIVTLGIGIYQLVGLIGTGLANAFKVMGASASKTLGWIKDTVVSVADNVNAMWNAFTRGAMVFLQTLKGVLLTTVGLFWNFQHNFAVIIDYFEKHGDKMFEDLAWASGEMVKAISVNLGKLAYAFGISFVSVFGAAWDTIKIISVTFFDWFVSQWGNMLSDINSLMIRFVKTLVSNWSVMEELFRKLMIIETAVATKNWPRIWGKSALAGMSPEEQAEFIAGKRTKVMEEAMGKMKGPLDELDTSKLKTNFTMLGEMMATSFTLSGNHWRIAGNSIAKAFSEAVAGMNPILAAFEVLQSSDVWKMFVSELKLELPGTKEIGDFMKQMAGLIPAGTTGEAAGKQGPGFTFKQGSLERFMYQSETTEKIQYQMLYHTQSIDKNVAYLAAQRNQSLLPGTNPNPRIAAPNSIEPMVGP